jgi:hypothetical protein
MTVPAGTPESVFPTGDPRLGRPALAGRARRRHASDARYNPYQAGGTRCRTAAGREWPGRE